MKREKLRKGMIFDIKRYAIHDGPGIRTTVFFKGCPLRCPWCQNPEGQEQVPEIMWHSSRCSEECRACLSVCPQKAIRKEKKVVIIDHSKCDFCGQCIDACLYEALEIVGREAKVDEIMKEVEKDRIFYEDSAGGVTFSGGEPLFQPEYLEALLGECQERNIKTAVDTCGYARSETIEKISHKVDLFLYDVKVINDQKHKEYTGVSNKIILENLEKLSKKGKKIVIRIPLMAGVNDDQENIKKTVEFLLPLRNIKEINLLPYHKGGAEKYKKLGKENLRPDIKPCSDRKMQMIKKRLENYGFSVKVGG